MCAARRRSRAAGLRRGALLAKSLAPHRLARLPTSDVALARPSECRTLPSRRTPHCSVQRPNQPRCGDHNPINHLPLGAASGPFGNLSPYLRRPGQTTQGLQSEAPVLIPQRARSTWHATCPAPDAARPFGTSRVPDRPSSGTRTLPSSGTPTPRQRWEISTSVRARIVFQQLATCGRRNSCVGATARVRRPTSSWSRLRVVGRPGLHLSKQTFQFIVLECLGERSANLSQASSDVPIPHEVRYHTPVLLVGHFRGRRADPVERRYDDFKVSKCLDQGVSIQLNSSSHGYLLMNSGLINGTSPFTWYSQVSMTWFQTRVTRSHGTSVSTT